MVMNNEQDESGPGPRPKAWWSRQGTMGKAAWVAGLLAVSGVMLGAALWLLHADRDVLFAHLSASDAAVFVAELDRLKQPYELSDGGTTILVDRSVVHATRLKLLGKDLPLHGAVGFELFNTSDAGMTEFAQKVNYQRALQGEITRTILSMEEVAAARVHLVLPEEGLFRREQARAKASVTLTLRNGRTLQAPQVAGIQRLIASAVPGVAVQDVTIVDNRGVALTRGGGSTAIVEGHAHLDLKREIEQHLARKANPMHRPRIDTVLETGVRAIDVLLPLGRGQRVGIFAGSGVGKSTLLGMVSRHVRADVNVIALIGERGREVKEFIERHLGVDGLARSVVVVATADQPALARLRAAYAALAIAEHFRAQGRQVLLTLDSITRCAMARREVGLAAGEAPTARGYTPSVFAELPQWCERCGTDASGGAITALFTVLVEGDDPNEPIADLLRATLDGHIVLSRDLAHRGQYPAIDILQSASRLLPDLAGAAEREQVLAVRRVLSLLERNRPMVEIGAHVPGVNGELDHALALEPKLLAFLSQREGGVSRAAAVQQLAAVLQEGNP